MTTPEIYLNSTLAYCPDCQTTELARIVVRNTHVFMDRMCPAQGTKSVQLAADYQWYRERTLLPQNLTQPTMTKPIQQGCPHDCGLCAGHSAKIHLPVFSITNDCNLNCPICFTYNRPDRKYYKSIADMQTIIEQLLEQAGNLELINITGGEPTRHPQLFEILAACQHPQIGRITMNTNGLRMAKDEAFANRIKDAGVQVVLSLDTFDSHKSKQIHGKDIVAHKLRALEILEKLQIPTTILSVCIKGVNEPDVVDIVHRYFKKAFVRSITIQNMTFTGQNGRQFQPREHITIDEIENELASRGEFSPTDFFPLGTYHPLCYSVAYYIVDDQRLFSLTQLIEKKHLISATEHSYLLNADPALSKYFLEGINRLWAEKEDEAFLKMLRNFIQTLYPTHRTLTNRERFEIAEQKVKMLYIHSHMDDDNFDIDRVSRCGDIVPDETGNMIPACAYNLLYRQRDERFWVESVAKTRARRLTQPNEAKAKF